MCSTTQGLCDNLPHVARTAPNNTDLHDRNRRRGEFLSTLLGSPADGETLRVLLAMMTLCDSAGVLDATNEQIAAACVPARLAAAGVTVSVRTVQRAKAALLACGYIENARNSSGYAALRLVPSCLRPYNADMQASAPASSARISDVMTRAGIQTHTQPTPNKGNPFDTGGSFSNVLEDRLCDSIVMPLIGSVTFLSSPNMTNLSWGDDRSVMGEGENVTKLAGDDRFVMGDNTPKPPIAQIQFQNQPTNQPNSNNTTGCYVQGADNAVGRSVGSEQVLGDEKPEKPLGWERAALLRANGFRHTRFIDDASRLPITQEHINTALAIAAKEAAKGKEHGYAIRLLCNPDWVANPPACDSPHSQADAEKQASSKQQAERIERARAAIENPAATAARAAEQRLQAATVQQVRSAIVQAFDAGAAGSHPSTWRAAARAIGAKDAASAVAQLRDTTDIDETRLRAFAAWVDVDLARFFPEQHA